MIGLNVKEKYSFRVCEVDTLVAVITKSCHVWIESRKWMQRVPSLAASELELTVTKQMSGSRGVHKSLLQTLCGKSQEG